MKRLMPLVCLLFLCTLAGCPKREQPPSSAYDPELLEAAREAAADREAEERAYDEENKVEETASECTREEGGCKKGFVCWDSYYCKGGFGDQCSASGDKRCHKLCTDDGDCPEKMPHCRTLPLFSGSDRGIEEKFCVGRRK
jgi:hypothetical protein